MKKSNTKKKKGPFWKGRILKDISRLRKDLGKIEAWFVGRWKQDKKKTKRLDRSKVRAKKKSIYVGNGRTETENNCKSYYSKTI